MRRARPSERAIEVMAILGDVERTARNGEQIAETRRKAIDHSLLWRTVSASKLEAVANESRPLQGRRW